MVTVFIAAIILVAIALVITILMQSGQGGGLSSSFGGNFMSGAVFGGKGAEAFLAKLTVILGIAFVLLVVATNVYLNTGGFRGGSSGSAFQNAEVGTPQETPGQIPQGMPAGQPGMPQGTPQGQPSGNVQPITQPAQEQPAGQE